MSVYDFVEAHKAQREIIEKNLFKDGAITVGPGSPVEVTVNIIKDTTDRDGNARKFTIALNKEEAVFVIKSLTYLFNL